MARMGRPKGPPIAVRFWAKVAVSGLDDCWLWTGARLAIRGEKTYGTFAIAHHVQAGAHRVAWNLVRGEIPEGMWVLHHCDNPPCVNPIHLFLGTPLQNSTDMHAKNRRKHKLSREDVIRIYLGSAPHDVTAERFGVACGTVKAIRYDQSWERVTKHLRRDCYYLPGLATTG